MSTPVATFPADRSISNLAKLIAEATEAAKAGRLARSLRLLDERLAASPDDGEVVYARALTLFDWGRLREALDGLRAAEDLGFSSFGSHLNLAQACNVLGFPDEAERHARQAIALNERDANGHVCLGAVLQTARRFDDAIASYERAYEFDSSRSDCLVHIAACELDRKDVANAERTARRAIAEDGGEEARSWSLLAVALARQDRYDEALTAFDRAEEIELHGGRQTESFVMHGYNLLACGRVADAIALYERHLPSHPHPSAHAHYGFALLTAGKYREGWEQYEFRWLDRKLAATRPAQRHPRWNGQSLQGKTLVLWAEQGYGDTIQFARFAPVLKERGASIVLRVPAKLRDLATGFVGVDRVAATFDEITGPVHYQLAAMSAPLVLGTTLRSIPRAVPYLRVATDRLTRWRQRLGGFSGIRVGLVWAGNANHENDRHRSISISTILPLLNVPGVRFFSLQKDRRTGDAAHFAVGEKLIDIGQELDDFSDTAAAIETLDLLIAVDTAIAHIAGALGKPCWLLLPTNADFRWLREGERTAWYPTMRLFRQESLGDWAEVIARVTKSLHEAVLAQDSGGIAAALLPPGGFLTEFESKAQSQSARADISRVAETRHGLIQYSPSQETLARSLDWYGEWLQPQINLLAKLLRPDSTVIEVASGIGVHAAAIAKIIGPTGHLFVYEADALLSRLLEQNLQIANLRNLVTVVPRGLAGVASSDESTNELDTVDALRLPRLDLIKINQPSALGTIIEGATETLWRLRPLLFIAGGERVNLDEAKALVKDFGYRCWRMCTRAFDQDNFNRREGDIFAGAEYLSLLAMPEEKEPPVALHALVEVDE